MTEKIRPAVSLPTVRRLPLYAAILDKAKKNNLDNISSSLIAKQLNLEPIQVRKDLAGIGITGQPRIGFPVSQLLDAIQKFLGWDNATDAFIIGAGNLGTALAGYNNFERNGLKIIAAFDTDPAKIGKTINGKKIFHLNKIRDLTKRTNVKIAVLTVPNTVAQNTASLLVDAGIKAIWNFTPVKLILPQDVIVERVDLAASFAVLSSRLLQNLQKLPNLTKPLGE